ncbi:hypothetical protein KI387_030481, partial [Taxus chinensis]
AHGTLQLHIPYLEEIWIDLRDEVTIIRKEHSRLNLDEIRNLNLAEVPEDAINNESIVETMYEQMD